jgi:hypothetical protein
MGMAWRTVEMHTGTWWGDLKERNHLEDLDVDGRIILKWIFKERDAFAWSGLTCVISGPRHEVH